MSEHMDTIERYGYLQKNLKFWAFLQDKLI